MRQFKIPKYPYEEDRAMFTKTELELEPNKVTCLVGCNGTGKTTVLYFIRRALEKLEAVDVACGYPHKGLKVSDELDFTKKEDFYADFSKNTDDAKSDFDWFMSKAAVAYSSTGEGITYRLGKLLETLGGAVADPDMKGKNLFIFFDDCDAGTSLDLIMDIKDVISLICEDCQKRGINFYFVITANSYEMCKDYDCIDVTTFEHVTFKDYDDYKKFVLKTRKYKDKELEKQERE